MLMHQIVEAVRFHHKGAMSSTCSQSVQSINVSINPRRDACADWASRPTTLTMQLSNSPLWTQIELDFSRPREWRPTLEFLLPIPVYSLELRRLHLRLVYEIRQQLKNPKRKPGTRTIATLDLKETLHPKPVRKPASILQQQQLRLNGCMLLLWNSI